MNREDLGKMLEMHLAYPVLVNEQRPSYYQEMFDAELQRGAEGFWNDVIDELRSRMEYQHNIMREVIQEPYEWLEDQKITED